MSRGFTVTAEGEEEMYDDNHTNYFEVMGDVPSTMQQQVGGRHYVDMSIQPWEVVDTWHLKEKVGFYRGNALKYILRMGRKGGATEDAKKAQHYIQKLIEVLEGACVTHPDLGLRMTSQE